ncbi:Copper fist DNA-binding protein [Cordyceps fumosorosea ARSEF 2679]|uniref:Copper fist DNA-binding protein n=1 Tax=Cordyceps fumosorosea (strain ARSEF 2679) TaxID=1081104 RepID=A0A167SBZ2_CORFA|nr:Copper fist DNA-binding protein [Cordyceps fumosorosea ARSEF 2679]OAA59469.1 Copper fist DNA-binding protein [Cordyceps fumosorosea ARSEF 2679]
MPLINGQKMACEPCIRGHRSTKCNHANDRLMVPVRKPGRPLSSCPHPASRPCSCAAVTAAIPKKQTCRCGPASSSSSSSCSAQPAASDPVKKEPESNGSSLPTSPTRSTPSAPFRVQKSSSKGASRKQSVGVAGLERMDTSQLNIIQGFDRSSQPSINGTNGMNGHAPMSGMGPYSAMGMPIGAPPFGMPGMYPMIQQPMVQPFTPEVNGSANGNGSSTNGNPETTSGSCCSGKQPPQTTTVEKQEAAIESKTEVSGSCCSSKTNGVSSPTQVPTENANGQLNGNHMPMFQPPMGMTNGMYPFFATPNIFTYPPQYGSYMQPLQPKQWRQAMSNMNMAPQVQQAYMFGGQTAVPPYQQAGAADTSTWTSHQCSCGDSCQCIGCAAHPYNDATQNYVRSAWNTMMQDAHAAHNGHGHASGTHSPTNGTHAAVNGQQLPHTNGITVNTSTGKTEGGAVSPTAPQTPSDATSGLAEEQALSASDFFFVSYPFADGCDGEMSSCQCGDDCQCIGCAIHNNPSPGIAN